MLIFNNNKPIKQKQWINTKVEFEWSKELQKYVEISSDGYWYDGEMALCLTHSEAVTIAAGAHSYLTIQTAGSGYHGGIHHYSAGNHKWTQFIGDTDTDYNMGFNSNSVNNVLVLDRSSGNVGIGTNDPKRELHIRKAGSGQAAPYENSQLVIESDGTCGLSILTPDANSALIGFGAASNSLYCYMETNYGGGNPYFTYYIGGAHRFRLQSDGKVGIGTTGPNGILHLQDSSGTAYLRMDSRVSDSSEGWYFKTSGTVSTTTLEIGSRWGSDTPRITVSGNKVGIGNTAPPQPLTVEGNISGSGNLDIGGEINGGADTFTLSKESAGLQQPMMQVRNYDTGNTGIFTNNYMVELRSVFTTGANSGALLVHTQENNSTRPVMNVSSNYGDIFTIVSTGTSVFAGNVGIGTTSPSARLHVSSSGSDLLDLSRAGTATNLYRFIITNPTGYSTNSLIVKPITGEGDVLFDDTGGTTTLAIDNSANSILIPAANAKISGSSTSTGSFGSAHIADNVGIGGTTIATAPEYKLVVDDASGGDGEVVALKWANAVDKETLIGFHHKNVGGYSPVAIGYYISSTTASTKGHLVFKTRDATSNSEPSERMRINADGKVGIGTTSPGVLVDAQTSTAAQAVMRMKSTHAAGETFVRSENSAGTYLGLLSYGASHAAYGTLGAAEHALYSTVPFTLLSEAGPIKFALGGGAEKMRIHTDGNVGIGTTSPGSPLHIYGTFDNKWGIIVDNNSTDGAGILVDANDNDNDEALLEARNAGTSRFIVKSGGKVGIGTASPGQPLHIKQQNWTEGLRIEAPDDTDYWDIVGHTGGPGNHNITFMYGGTSHFRILSTNGDLYATDTNGFTSISDSQLKQNIANYTSGLNLIKLLEPKSWEWKNPEHHAYEQTHGIVAQDLEAIKGEDVILNSLYREYDVENDNVEKDLIEDGTVRAVKFSAKDAMYISAIKELLAKVEALENA